MVASRTLRVKERGIGDHSLKEATTVQADVLFDVAAASDVRERVACAVNVLFFQRVSRA